MNQQEKYKWLLERVGMLVRIPDGRVALLRGVDQPLPDHENPKGQDPLVRVMIPRGPLSFEREWYSYDQIADAGPDAKFDENPDLWGERYWNSD